MPLSPGSRLGPYQIEGAIGAGGMGEVYRARDTRLDRAVAIKTLPAEFSRDVRRRSRFQREAKTIAGLSHPHICALHDVGEHEGTDFLVMELLDGESLAERLSRGPLPLAQALAYATQIASALAQAHGAGVVHRDLKPGNVMITRAGPKLLDFGLATIARDDDVAGVAQTVTGPVTEEGQIVGTLGYMAPEQLEGRGADARTDIFAFGTMLYEMITGERAFGGGSRASVIGNILHRDPPAITERMPDAPPALARLVRVCLAKNPDDRWSSAHDLALQLASVNQDAAAARQAVPVRSTREAIAWGVAAVATVAAIVLAVTRGTSLSEAPAAFDVLAIVPPSDTIQPFADAPQISPDGRHVAFVATDRSGRTSLYVRALVSESVRALPGTDDASLPFWAPDSRRLGFFATGHLKTTSLDADAPQAIAPAPVPRGGSWSSDGVIVFSSIPSLPLQQVAATGGAVSPVLRPQVAPATGGQPPLTATDQRWFPSFLPDSRRYLFLGRSSPTAPYAVGVGSLDSPETVTLIESRSPAVYASGHLLYRREGTLIAHPFDLETRTLRGNPVPIVDRVGFNAITYQGLFSASTTGRIAYQSNVVQSELVWYDRRGSRTATAAGVGGYNTICLMDNERRLVYELADERTGNVDLWTRALDGGPPSRLTFEGAVDFYPVCPPAGDEVIFATLGEGPPNLMKVPVSSPGKVSPVERVLMPKIATDISRDGRLLIFAALQAGSAWDIFVKPLPDGQPRPFVSTPAEERNARLSPDGRWIAYVSNESDRFEVYVQPFPATGSRWQVSTAGGLQPQWRGDGRELYYVSPDKKLTAVDVKTTGAVFAWGAPRALMETRMTGWERISAGCCQYAVSRDGERFLISTATTAATPITIASNWPTLTVR